MSETPKIGFGGFKVYIGENLSLENEKITYDYAKILQSMNHADSV